MDNKLQMLCWSDSPEVSTGFGVVAKNILKVLYSTGKFKINVLGINYFGRFYNQEEFPYQITPARLLDPNDPYGNRMLIRSLNEKKYDILFIINDTYVTNKVADEVAKIKSMQPNLKVIYYFPVDCLLSESSANMVRLADIPVTYTNFAKKEVLKTLPNLINKLEVIYHGTDTDKYYPISIHDRIEARAKYFNIQDDNTFVWINVNRNSVRKNLPQTILAFSEFRKRYNKPSLLYLHTVPQDQGINLLPAIEHLGLSTTTDVIFPVNYNSVDAYPDYILNEFYNASDGSISTSTGEGWGLGITEAMAAGLLVIAGNHTSTPELLGDKRGFIYPCKERCYIDSSGYRPLAQTEDVVNSMLQVAYMNKDMKSKYINNARKFTEKYSWKNIGQEWLKLFTKVENSTYSAINIETI